MKTLLAILLLMASTVQAVEFELNLGQTVYDKSANGQWYQNGLDYKFHLQANSLGFAFTDYLADGMRWRVGYINLGEMSSSALATTDANYNGSNGCIGACVEKAVFIGRGNVEGIYVTVAPEMKLGKIKLFAEGGIWGYIPHFNMVVYRNNPAECADCAVKVWDKTTDEHMQFGPVIGAGIEYDNIQLVVTVYATQVSQVNGDTVPNWGERTTNVSLRKRF